MHSKLPSQPRSPSLFLFFLSVLLFASSVCLSLQWSKGKARDKLNNAVLFNKDSYEKLLKDIPTAKLITPAVVSDRLKIRGSLARRAIDELIQKGLIKPVVRHNSIIICTRATA